MNVCIMRAFQALDRQVTIPDVREACKQLFLRSDEYSHAGQFPFSASEVDAVGSAIYDYIADPTEPLREIVFDVPRILEGKSIEYNEYASMFSEDMLYDSYSERTSPDAEQARASLKRFLAAILFRYQFCVTTSRAAFPVSVLLDYMDDVRLMLSREGREGDWPDALWRTLDALRSLEPRYRARQDGSQPGMRNGRASGG